MTTGTKQKEIQKLSEGDLNPLANLIDHLALAKHFPGDAVLNGADPVWFYYDKNEEKLFLTTSKLAKKIRNLRDNPDVYFSIDDETSAPKGVKGRGTVMMKEDTSKTVSIGDKVSMKYLGTLDHPIAKMITDLAKKGEVVLIEISPKFFSTWDYSKAQ